MYMKLIQNPIKHIWTCQKSEIIFVYDGSDVYMFFQKHFVVIIKSSEGIDKCGRLKTKQLQTSVPFEE